MVHQVLYQSVICVSVKEYLIPILLVEMPGSFNGIVTFTQFQCIFGVSFHGDAVRGVEVDA